MRYAIYFTPPADHPLTHAASLWLGRDAFADKALEPGPIGDPSVAEWSAHVKEAARYGFHATLKAPFTLAEGQTAANLDAALAEFAAVTSPVAIDRLSLQQIDGFFALVPATENEALQALAGDIVRTFDRFRAPLTDAERERRRPDQLSAQELANLVHWGYPHVFDTFRFHMTLSGRAFGDEAARLEGAIRQALHGRLDAPISVNALALFVEPEPGAPFSVRSYHHLAGTPPAGQAS